MNKILKGYLLGTLSTVLLAGGITYAKSTNEYVEASYNNIKLVVDGKQITPTDSQGNTVEPFISNGTTYLPVRAVAQAVGKEVYWDGPNYTVYLGNMSGRLEYPSAKLTDLTNIGSQFRTTNKLKDNYNNQYSTAFCGYSESNYEYLLNMKYSRFKCILYVPEGETDNRTNYINIETDGKIVYTSPAITKVSSPINVDIDITGCNDFKIIFSDDWPFVHVGDAGFYQ